MDENVVDAMVLHYPLLSPLEVVLGNQETVLSGHEGSSWKPVDSEDAHWAVGCRVTCANSAVVGVISEVKCVDELITKLHGTSGALL